MSKSALSFLILALMAVAADLLLPAHSQVFSSVAKVAAGAFTGMFVIALFLGRRFKFDPVLR